jgi:NodT family efflux transporter outer membrane factor (OMF) lipoprotein
VEVADDWTSEQSGSMQTAECDDLAWWERLNDPILNQLIAYAYCQNLDLRIAAMRVIQARMEVKGKKADLYPRIDATAACGHVYFSKNALVDGLLGNTCFKRKHVKRNVNFYEVGFDAEWEIDLFGMTAHEVAALKAHEEAVQEDLCAIWVTLTAEIARNYIELRGLQQRLVILERSLQAQEYSIQIFLQLQERGIVNDVDLSKAQAEKSSIKAQMPLLELGIQRAIHRLSILLGDQPGSLISCLETVRPLPHLPCELPIGIPSDILRRRPDIGKAERELAAATERVGSAIAALFPRFSLRGFIGEISTHAGSLFSPASATYLIGPQLLVPIFNSHMLMQDIDYAKNAVQEAIYVYQKTVLEALEESENAIAAFRHEEKRRLHLEDSLRNYERTLTFAIELYQKGVEDYLTVANAEKLRLTAEDISVQSQVDLLLHYISLYKALGGSWENECCE